MPLAAARLRFVLPFGFLLQLIAVSLSLAVPEVAWAASEGVAQRGDSPWRVVQLTLGWVGLFAVSLGLVARRLAYRGTPQGWDRE